MSRRTILWRIPRTGGNSVQLGLELAGVIFGRPGGRSNHCACGHATPSEVVELGWMTESEIHDSTNLICGRNVWERLVSLFALLRTTGWKTPGLERWKDAPSRAFGEYIAWATSPLRETEYHHRNYQGQPASDWMQIDGRAVPFAFVGTLDKLPDYWRFVSEAFGVSGHLCHVNDREHRPYREYYMDATRDMVASFYADEIRMFGWEF